MLLPAEWSVSCDAIAAELLSVAGVESPPFDMFVLAERLELGVAWDAGQTGRGRLLRLNGDPAIFLRPDERPERLQWAMAHEIGETAVWRVAQRLSLDTDDLLPRQRESLASQLANRLLLPQGWWNEAVRTCGQHLPRLKQRFATASHELIAWRLLDGADAKMVTIIDNGQVTRRRANFVPRCPPPSINEQQCWETARQEGEATGDPVRGLFPVEIPARCHAWAIHEPTWQREIAVTWVEIDMENLSEW